jgi:hypothetical protein
VAGLQLQICSRLVGQKVGYILLDSQPIDHSDGPTIGPVAVGKDRVVYLNVLKTLDDR